MKTTQDVKQAVSLLVAGAALSPEDAATVRLMTPHMFAALDACEGVPTELLLPGTVAEMASAMQAKRRQVQDLKTKLARAESALRSIESQWHRSEGEIERLRAVCEQAERVFRGPPGTRPTEEHDALEALRAMLSTIDAGGDTNLQRHCDAVMDAWEVACRDLDVAHSVMRMVLPALEAAQGGVGSVDAAAAIRAVLAREGSA